MFLNPCLAQLRFCTPPPSSARTERLCPNWICPTPLPHRQNMSSLVSKLREPGTVPLARDVVCPRLVQSRRWCKFASGVTEEPERSQTCQLPPTSDDLLGQSLFNQVSLCSRRTG